MVIADHQVNCLLDCLRLQKEENLLADYISDRKNAKLEIHSSEGPLRKLLLAYGIEVWDRYNKPGEIDVINLMLRVAEETTLKQHLIFDVIFQCC